MADESYAKLMPYIDVQDGLKRVMGKKKMLLSLINRFDAQKMVGNLVEAINQGDKTKIVETAHAVKGVAGNLGLTPLRDIMVDVETKAKAEEDCSGLIGEINEILNKTQGAIAELMAMPE